MRLAIAGGDGDGRRSGVIGGASPRGLKQRRTPSHGASLATLHRRGQSGGSEFDSAAMSGFGSQLSMATDSSVGDFGSEASADGRSHGGSVRGSNGRASGRALSPAPGGQQRRK